MPTFSAYLSVYNDYDILSETLSSIKNYVSEIVVVDGGYTWMSSYLKATGKDPIKSVPELYEILDASNIKYRTINRLWKNEIEKRIAGYEACNTDYVYRIDADEITFLSSDVLSSFIENKGAVAEMDLPMYDSPGYVQWHKNKDRYPRQGFLFDRNQVNAQDHLHYLWLVLTSDKLREKPTDLKPIYHEPVAFNAHLSHWRTPKGGSQRAVFYTLNYMRQHGAPARANLAPGPIEDFSELFQLIPPKIFETAMKRSEVINSQFRIDQGYLSATPLSKEEETTFDFLYTKFLHDVNLLDEESSSSNQGFIAGTKLCFHRKIELIGQPWKLKLEFDCNIDSADACLNSVFFAEPFTAETMPDLKISGRCLEISVPETSFGNPLLRQILTVSIMPPAPIWFGSFKIVA